MSDRAKAVLAERDALLAERDAAYRAGQEDMRERAAEAVWDTPSATDNPHGEADAIIRALPIKEKPDGR